MDVRVSFFLSVFCDGAGFFRRSGFRFWEAAYLIWFFSLVLRKGKKRQSISRGDCWCWCWCLVGGLVEQVGCNHPQPLHTIRGGSSFLFPPISLSLCVVYMCAVCTYYSFFSFFFCDSSHTFLLSPSLIPFFPFFFFFFWVWYGLVWSSCGARNLYWFGLVWFGLFIIYYWTACSAFCLLFFLLGRCWIACISCFVLFFCMESSACLCVCISFIQLFKYSFAGRWVAGGYFEIWVCSSGWWCRVE